MKKLLVTIAILLSVSLTAQVAVFHPVKIPQNQIEKFLEVETNYSQKVAQDAVNKGNLVWWALMKSFNTTADTSLLTLSGSQVGIGTVDPQTGRLHIHNGDSGATSYVQFTQDGTGTSGTNGLLVGVNAAEASIVYNGENTPLIFLYKCK